MARDNYVGWTIQEKLALLRGVQEARLTGQVVRCPKPGGGYTEFDVTKTDPTRILEELEFSIVNDEDFDADNPVHAACASNARPGVTRIIYSR